jgi:hypothetical protein
VQGGRHQRTGNPEGAEGPEVRSVPHPTGRVNAPVRSALSEHRQAATPWPSLRSMTGRVRRDLDTLSRHWEQLADRAAWVTQPFVPGTAGRLSLLAREGAATLLSVNRPRIAMRDDTLVLQGCVVNGLDDSHGR